ncbi:hypothetical protein [Thermodesulfatator indicus]
MKNIIPAASLGPPLTIERSASIDEALNLFSLSGEDLLIVLEKGNYVGVLSRRTLTNAKRYNLQVSLSDILEEIPVGEYLPELEFLKNPLGAFLLLKNNVPQSLITLRESPIFENHFEKMVVEIEGDLKTLADIINETATALDISVYLVGGVVRDLVIGQPCFDIDLVVTEKAEEFAKNLARALRGKIVKKSLFGTFKIEAGDYVFDVAQARWEYYEAPAKLPKVAPGPLRQDLWRRDFTINALALYPENSLIIDLYGGLADIFARKLRVFHVLSFVEDPTRIFRAARYTTRFNLELTGTTIRALELALKLEVLNLLTPARLRNEFLRILEERDPVAPLLFLQKHKVLHQLFSLTLEENEIKSSLYLAEKAGLDIREKLELLALLYAGTPEEFAKLELSPQKFENYQKQLKILAEKRSWFFDSRVSLSEKVFFLEKFPKVILCAAASFLEEDFLLRCFKNYFKVKPGLSGEDLKKLGFKSGPLLGEMLKRLRAAKLDGQIKDGEEEIFLKKELGDGFSS